MKKVLSNLSEKDLGKYFNAYSFKGLVSIPNCIKNTSDKYQGLTGKGEKKFPAWIKSGKKYILFTYMPCILSKLLSEACS